MTATTTNRWSKTSVSEIKTVLRTAGSHFFDRDTVKFFGTNTFSNLAWKASDGSCYLWVQSDDYAGEVIYSVRFFDADNPMSVETFEGAGNAGPGDNFFDTKFRAANLAQAIVSGELEAALRG